MVNMYKLSRTTEEPSPYSVSVVGVGGAGCNAVSCISPGDGGPSVVAVNTDSESLEASKATVKLQIGLEITKGVGAGGDSRQGRMAAEQDLDKILELFTDRNLVIVVAGLGGGTGTGALPVILKAARTSGALTIAFVTTPFSFEGDNRRATSDAGIALLRDTSDILISVSNDKLFESVEESQVNQAFERADTVISAGICSIWQMLMKPGFIAIELGDLKAVASSTATTFAFGEGEGSDRVSDAISMLLDGPLLDCGCDLADADNILVCITGDNKLLLSDVGEIMTALSKKTSDSAKIMMGMVVDNDLDEKIMVSVFAGGLKNALPDVDLPTPLPSRKTKKNKAKALQSKLRLGASGKGRFKDVEATMMDGEDYDIPTYVRRGLKI